jgi:hypothetical protein
MDQAGATTGGSALFLLAASAHDDVERGFGPADDTRACYDLTAATARVRRSTTPSVAAPRCR